MLLKFFQKLYKTKDYYGQYTIPSSGARSFWIPAESSMHRTEKTFLLKILETII